MEENHTHNYSFFGKKSGLLFQSAKRDQPYVFFRFIKKKDSGDWEKPSNGEGKVIKFSLEEIIMILEVLNKKIPSWDSYHKFKNDDSKIGFRWQKEHGENLWINVNEYSKMLNFSQLEILKRLLDHILEEKIIYATRPKKSFSSRKSEQKQNKKRNKRQKKSGHSESKLHRDSDNEKSNEDGEKVTEVEGLIKAQTEKAVLIEFEEGSEEWIPKSLIKSNYVNSEEISQKFLIDTWLLKKSKIMA